jgi:UDP-glucose 4-epimerase
MGKVLITGGAGFVGSHLAKRIKPSVLFDWRNPGYLFKRAGEKSRLIYENCKFVHGDVRKPRDLEKCLKFGRIDVIIHLAAIPGVKLCNENPRLAREVNVGGTRNVLEFARRNDILRVLFASAAAVYGEIKRRPITEDHPINPLNLYAETKVKGEELCRGYSEKYGIKYTIMRMSNVYGPGFQVKPNLSVVPRFVLRAFSNQPLTIYGDGEQTRDFVHVEDVAQAQELALEMHEAENQIFNIGSGEATSVNELAKVIRKAMRELYDREVKVERIEVPEWRREARGKFAYSIEKAKELLDYKPRRSLKDSILEMLRRTY